VSLKPHNLARGVLLAAATAFLGIVWLAREFDINTDELLNFLVTSVGFVIGIAIFAALLAGIIRLFRR
jgi:hypothetical protein